MQQSVVLIVVMHTTSAMLLAKPAPTGIWFTPGWPGIEFVST